MVIRRFTFEIRSRRMMRMTRKTRRRPIKANIPTSLVDFRGFDSSIILNFRGGIIMSIGNFPESLNQAMLVGIMLVGRLGVVVLPVAWLALLLVVALVLVFVLVLVLVLTSIRIMNIVTSISMIIVIIITICSVSSRFTITCAEEATPPSPKKSPDTQGQVIITTKARLSSGVWIPATDAVLKTLVLWLKLLQYWPRVQQTLCCVVFLAASRTSVGVACPFSDCASAK